MAFIWVIVIRRPEDVNQQNKIEKCVFFNPIWTSQGQWVNVNEKAQADNGNGLTNRYALWHNGKYELLMKRWNERSSDLNPTIDRSIYIYILYIYIFTTINWHIDEEVLLYLIKSEWRICVSKRCHHWFRYSISQEICTRFLLCCALLWLYIDWFPHIHQAYFTGTVAI